MDDLIRVEVADEVEAAGSILCDCDPDSNPPIGKRIGTRWETITHHCECRAVLVSAVVRRGLSTTLHERECSDHGYGEHYRG
ncbi:hypothetical protein AB0383_20495 [Amycolatopsis sp. NPDC051373]|uniref:hypothetical protein n=1 Tax=Amycolatopsis sp. NPDC051373 TaxID=3155801 RepID=UPI00344B1D68